MSSELRCVEIVSYKEPAAMQQHGDKLNCSKSWRKSNDELRKVIKDNLQRASLLSTHFNDEQACLSSRSLRFSVSNGISSKSYREERREESVPSKAPSLIARLMGLDNVPSKVVESAKKDDNSKNSDSNTDSPTSMFQFGSVKSRNLQSDTPKPKRITLRILIDRELLEGHTNSDRDTEGEALSGSSESSPSSADSSPYSSYDKRLHMIEVAPQLLNFKDVHIPCSVIDEVREILTPNKILKDEHDYSKKIGRQKVVSLPTKFEGTQQTTKTDLIRQRQSRKDELKPLKRADSGHKHGLSRIDYSQKKELKKMTDNFSRSVTTKPTRTLPESVTVKRRLVTAKSSSSTKVGAQQKCDVATQIRSSSVNSQTRTENTSRNQSARRITTIKPTRQKEGKEMRNSRKTNYILQNTVLNSSGNYRQTNQSKKSSKDSLIKDKKKVFEIMPKSKKDRSYEIKDEAIMKPRAKEVSTIRRGRARNLNDLLLNSPSFLVNAYKLCHHSPRPLNEENSLNGDEKHAKLYLACAQELIERKAYHLKLSSHPMLRTSPWSSSTYENMDHLVRKISESITNIMSYSKNDNVAYKTKCIDNLNTRPEKDLRCQDDLNAMWNLSWSNGIYVEETDQLVAQIEEHVLSMLIAHIAMELLQ